MSFQHQKLANGRWNSLSFFEQMANIGSEAERAINWQVKNNLSYSQMAIERALELLHLTIDDGKNRKRLKELTRLREVFIDYFIFENQYSSSDELWQKYFRPFNYAAQLNKPSILA